MKKLMFLVIFISVLGFSQSAGKQIRQIKKFQKELNSEYKNPKETPLRNENFTNFRQHPFFPIDLKYRISAKLMRTPETLPFEMPTSSGKSKLYRQFGILNFSLDGKKYTLNVYQSLSLMKQKGYEDYLFLPFRDETNGKQTYGGGKYLDLKIPKEDSIILDFNKSYQPYCAYNAYDYNCPVVPEENKLPVEIKAGVMYEDVYHH